MEKKLPHTLSTNFIKPPTSFERGGGRGGGGTSDFITAVACLPLAPRACACASGYLPGCRPGCLTVWLTDSLACLASCLSDLPVSARDYPSVYLELKKIQETKKKRSREIDFFLQSSCSRAWCDESITGIYVHQVRYVLCVVRLLPSCRLRNLPRVSEVVFVCIVLIAAALSSPRVPCPLSSGQSAPPRFVPLPFCMRRVHGVGCYGVTRVICIITG